MKETVADDTVETTGSPDAVLAKGDKVGRYTVDGKVGQGGMGLVYRATDPQLHRDVALKLVRPDHVSGRGGEQHRARLLREARAMAQLRHPNVVRVYDVGEHDGGVFVAMEFVDGKDGHRWIREEKPAWPRVVGVFRAAGKGLAAAHDAGLVHRDFKPPNILLGEHRVQVMDFGLARSAEDIRGGKAELESEDDWSEAVTSDGVVVGTPAYMAPEQFHGAPADARTDQYSFCVSLWEALFRQLPFAGRTAKAMAAAKLNDQLRDPPQEIEVPPQLLALLRRGLSADRDDRYGGMPDVLRELRTIAESVETETPTPDPAPPPPRRIPWLLVGVIGVGSVAAWTVLRKDPCDPDQTSVELRRAYAAAEGEEAKALALDLAAHWQGRGCDPLAREWSALAR